MIRDKFCVGLISTREIVEGDELLYDYSVRGQDWMMERARKGKVVKKEEIKVKKGTKNIIGQIFPRAIL